MNKISFFTDLQKHNEFINRLNHILNLEDSTIKYCYLDYQFNRKMAITIESFNSTKNNCRSFVFNDFFLLPERENDDFYTILLKDGFSKKDIDLLIELFDDYTFENHYEGMFFATRLSAAVNPSTQENRIVFKFTHDESCNKFVINGIPATKHYVVISSHEMPNIFYSLKQEDFSSSGYHKLKTSYHQLINDTNQTEAIDTLKKLHEIGQYDYVLEVYKSFLTHDLYVNNFIYFDGNKIITENLKNWKQH